MIDFVKKLFEDNVISEDIKSEIESAWQSRIEENRDQVTATLREEFAQKYEHDKSAMVEAVEAMLADRLQAELSELAEDRQGLIEARAKYAKKMQDDSKAMESFILNNLRKELAELHEDRKAVAGNIARYESFIVDALAKEIAEFHADKKDLAETKVRLIRDSKAKFEAIKKDFINKSATIVQETVSKGLRSEMNQLKEDIDEARRNDFGRKLFEAFASEYSTSYLNEKSETAKLLKVIDLKNLELAEAQTMASKAGKILESKEAEIRMLKEAQERKAIMSELLAPLNSEQREIMGELMESVKTTRLNESFDKYLPAVLNGTAGKTPQKKQALVEAKEITGNKVSNSNRSSEGDDSNIVDIRRLAGLKI